MQASASGLRSGNSPSRVADSASTPSHWSWLYAAGGDVAHVRRPFQVEVAGRVALVLGGLQEVDHARRADEEDHLVDAVGLELLGGERVLLVADAPWAAGLDLGGEVDAGVGEHLLERVGGVVLATFPVQPDVLALERAAARSPSWRTSSRSRWCRA